MARWRNAYFDENDPKYKCCCCKSTTAAIIVGALIAVAMLSELVKLIVIYAHQGAPFAWQFWVQLVFVGGCFLGGVLAIIGGVSTKPGFLGVAIVLVGIYGSMSLLYAIVLAICWAANGAAFANGYAGAYNDADGYARPDQLLFTTSFFRSGNNGYYGYEPGALNVIITTIVFCVVFAILMFAACWVFALARKYASDYRHAVDNAAYVPHAAGTAGTLPHKVHAQAPYGASPPQISTHRNVVYQVGTPPPPGTYTSYYGYQTYPGYGGTHYYGRKM